VASVFVCCVVATHFLTPLLHSFTPSPLHSLTPSLPHSLTHSLNMTFSLSTCPCCLPATLIIGVVATWVLLQIVGGFLSSTSTPGAVSQPPSVFKRVIQFGTKSCGVLLIFFAIFLGVLESNEDLRKLSFSVLCAKLTQDTALDVLRCGECVGECREGVWGLYSECTYGVL
jgi:hypothetical protein